ncbi:suppressor of disruption of TFIIS isoform X1 [Arabidopsis lyrata subsp. lyrata]|uniref:suppressor of disruption of TFIIS isoform X1 n=2 Tax=Arabidopsis lyrata subsp. lyrata TaxID=81972 RepID=UPI000A29BE65|nr:suppressor of disruption of TFIIS isoform X1 [Arabidopsis lyrata subsp. lyrata]|eukprot:XP_020871978.1 suppressor of disruption of TFIIS isoform X1 [Arabidopsis lyrata subsp. lyrata]
MLFLLNFTFIFSQIRNSEEKTEFVTNSTPRYECLLFDLDDTLYPLSSGLSEACANNIMEFMVPKLGIEEDKVVELNQLLYRKYGTSMAGLKAIGYEFDNDEYHSYVHGRLPYENLKPDPVLRNLLLSLPFRKLVFSNGDDVHVVKALKRLGIEDCFERIISFETLNPKTNEAEVSCVTGHLSENLVICKPTEIAFEKAFDIAQLNPHKSLFFDDSIRNIQTGKVMGLHTVLVGKSRKVDGSDYALESIHNMKEAFPELWLESNSNNNNEKSKRISYAAQFSIATSVEA